MAAMIKLEESDVVGICRHDNREYIEQTATRKVHIDSDRSRLNEDMTPKRTKIIGKKNPRTVELSKRQYFYRRLAELPHLRRKDLKVVCEWVVTLPKEITPNSAQDKAFFRATFDFLAARYGEENIITANVHRDETTPHLHFCFIPVDSRGRISAKNVMKRAELCSFHPQLQAYLSRCGIDCNVNSGITRQQGGNRTVAELKKEKTHKITRAKQHNDYEHRADRTRE